MQTLSEPVGVTLMTKLVYDPEMNYVKKLNVFFNEGYLNFFFTSFNMSVVGEYICSTVMSDACNNPVHECTEKLEKLAISEGADVHFDGNTQGC